MKLFIRGAQIIDDQTSHHCKKRNILIEEGYITAIDQQKYTADQVIDANGMMLSIGWFDMRAHFCEPGWEWKENLLSGIRAATAGGFTGVALLPNTYPVLDNCKDIAYIQYNNTKNLTQCYPFAALTKYIAGKELAELIDLYQAGAVAFTDGENTIESPQILYNGLRYLQKFNGLLINKPVDKQIAAGGCIHEGIHSMQLGLDGIPSLAEELMVQRDLSILAYTGGRLHFTCISTEASIALIKKAKQKGLLVSCDIAAYQPILTDTMVGNFNTAYKVDPPLRTIQDNQALLQGLKDDTVDIIVSNHIPQGKDEKKTTFEEAAYGMIGLQTMLPLLGMYVKQGIAWEKLIKKITITPRLLLKLPLPKIQVGEKVNCTLFDPNKKWTLNEQTNYSASSNTPYYQQQLTGKVIAVLYKEKINFVE